MLRATCIFTRFVTSRRPSSTRSSPNAKKQARLGWAEAVHMARHYTDAVTEEDQKAAEFVGRLLDDGLPQVGQGTAQKEA